VLGTNRYTFSGIRNAQGQLIAALFFPIATQKMQRFQVNALNFARAFSEQTRDNGSHFFMLPESAPAWMHDAVRLAHDDEFPNDWRFATARAIAYGLAECESIENARDDAMELADTLSSIYTAEILSWYAEIPSRLDYCDQYQQDFGNSATDSTGLLLGAAQAYAIEQMVQVILNACEARAVEIELFPV
jgi:hypothetical protein